MLKACGHIKKLLNKAAKNYCKLDEFWKFSEFLMLDTFNTFLHFLFITSNIFNMM